MPCRGRRSLRRRSPRSPAAGPGWRTCRSRSPRACRALHERRLPADRQQRGPGAGAVPAVGRVPERRAARDPGRRERPAGHPAGPACRSPRRGAAAWSPRSTGCGSSSRSRPRSPAQPQVLRAKRGMTWLNAINERGMGRSAPVGRRYGNFLLPDSIIAIYRNSLRREMRSLDCRCGSSPQSCMNCPARPCRPASATRVSVR
jgi:hypothetical protein